MSTSTSKSPGAFASTLTPRLASSLKWTELPSEFIQKIIGVFTAQFPEETKTGEFIVDGRIFPEEVVMRVGYLEEGRLKQINFEVSVDLPKSASPLAALATAPASAPEDGPDGGSADGSNDGGSDGGDVESKTMSRLYLAIDALGSLMEEYFQAGSEDEMDLPLRWREFEFENEKIFLQYSTANTRLEAEANRLLKLAGVGLEDTDGLFHDESFASEDALSNAEVDEELAMEVQNAIRSGKYQHLFDAQARERGLTPDSDSESETNA